MKLRTNNSSPKSIAVIFRDWVLVMPLIVGCVAVAGFVLVCWLGDGTFASLYRVEYFMPLPLYSMVVFIVTYLPMVVLGFVITGVSLMRRQLSK